MAPVLVWFSSPGSIVGKPSSTTTSRPPRCPVPDACTATQTPPGVATSPFGRLPTPIAAVGFPVPGSILTTRRPNSALTQSPPSPKASAEGLPATGIALRTASVVGSTRTTVPSSSFAIQRAPSPYTIPAGPPPTEGLAVTVFVLGSTSTTRPVDSSVTHTAPAPMVIPPPTAFVRIRLPTTSPVAESIRETVRSSEFVTQTEPYPTATAVGPLPTWIFFTSV